MRRLVAILSLGAAWLCANGAVWDVVQVFAWSRMFAGYAETMPLAAALQETFDPAKPCELCGTVATAKDQAREQLPSPTQREGAKFALVIQDVAVPVFANDPGEWPALTGLTATRRTEPVRLQPPRA